MRKGTTVAVAIAAPLLGALAGLGAVVLSVLWWRTEANLCFCEHCPDLYCQYGHVIRSVLTQWDSASLQQLAQFARWYQHAHSPLTPVLQALVSLVIPDPIASFMAVSIGATIVSWVVVRRVIRTGWSPQAWLMALLFAAFCTHVLVVRALARPLTDAVGMACTVGGLWALQRYLERRDASASAVLLGIQFLGLFARVSFIPMLCMPVLGEVAVPGSLSDRARRALRSGLLYSALPAALYFGINAGLGTLHHGEALRFAHREEFTHFYTLRDFLTGLTLAGQGYVVLLLAGVSRPMWTSLTFRVHAIWVLTYAMFLASGGGALWPRYFLPLVPSVFVLSAPLLSNLGERHPWNVRALLAVFIVGNVLYAGPVSRDLRPVARQLAVELRAHLAGRGVPPDLVRLAPAGLAVTTDHEASGAGLASDGNLQTSWASAPSQGPGIQIQVDLGSIYPVRGLVLWTTLAEYPRGFTVETSLDGTAWTSAAERRGVRGLIGFLDEVPHLFVPLAGEPARHLRISATRRDPARWRIHEIGVYVAGR